MLYQQRNNDVGDYKYLRDQLIEAQAQVTEQKRTIAQQQEENLLLKNEVSLSRNKSQSATQSYNDKMEMINQLLEKIRLLEDEVIVKNQQKEASSKKLLVVQQELDLANKQLQSYQDQ